MSAVTVRGWVPGGDTVLSMRAPTALPRGESPENGFRTGFPGFRIGLPAFRIGPRPFRTRRGSSRAEPEAPMPSPEAPRLEPEAREPEPEPPSAIRRLRHSSRKLHEPSRKLHDATRKLHDPSTKLHSADVKLSIEPGSSAGHHGGSGSKQEGRVAGLDALRAASTTVEHEHAASRSVQARACLGPTRLAERRVSP